MSNLSPIRKGLSTFLMASAFVAATFAQDKPHVVPKAVFDEMLTYRDARIKIPAESGLHTTLRGGVLMSSSSLRPYVLLNVKSGRKVARFQDEEDPSRTLKIAIDRPFQTQFWDYLPPMGATFTGGRSSVVIGFSTGNINYGQSEQLEGDNKQTHFFAGFGFSLNPDVSVVAGFAFGASLFDEGRIAAVPSFGFSINPDILGRLFKG